jgi:hypothetical protein
MGIITAHPPVKESEMSTITIFWLLFTVIFSVLAAFHIWAATKKTEYFKSVEFHERDQPPGVCITVTVISQDIDELTRDLAKQINDFVANTNSFVDSFNTSNRRANIKAAAGYIAAAVTSLASLYLSRCSP